MYLSLCVMYLSLCVMYLSLCVMYPVSVYLMSVDSLGCSLYLHMLPREKSW